VISPHMSPLGLAPRDTREQLVTSVFYRKRPDSLGGREHCQIGPSRLGEVPQ
jgi:hypothetical protein